MATIVAVVGTIAGAGTTTVVTELGTALGEQRVRAALVDATAEGSRLTDAIDVDGGGDLTDALRRGTALGEVQAAGPHDVAAFPAGPETNWGAVRPDAVAEVYDGLRDRFDVVLVDAGNAPSVARAAWLGHADEAVIVTDPDVAGTIPEIEALATAFDVPVRGVLANRVPMKEIEDAIEALGATGQPVLGVLPEDSTVAAAAEAGDSVLRAEPDSPIATCIWKLALRFPHDDHDDPVVPAGTTPASTPQPDASEESASGGEEEGGAATAAHEDDEAAADAAVESAASGDAGDAGASEADGAATSKGDDAATADTDGAAIGDADDGFVTAEAQPVDTSESDGAADSQGTGENRDEETSSTSVGGSSGPEPASAAKGSGTTLGSDDAATTRGDAADREADADPLDGIGDLDVGLSDDDPADGSVQHGSDGDPGRERRGSDSEDAGGSGDAELSDEEIEAVFQETMQRVQERREKEDDGGD